MSCGCGCSGTGTCSCDDNCPEVVPVTINDNDYTVDGPGISLALTQDSATKVTLVFTGDVEDYINIRCWLEDGPIPDREVSLSVPSELASNEFEIVTDSTGAYSLVIENNGALDTWYLMAEVMGLVTVSPAITIGV